MRLILVLAIRCYWRFWPKRWRGSCLFKETCSKHVYRVAVELGARKALAALRFRFRTCRGGFLVVQQGGTPMLQLVDGSLVSQVDASPELFPKRGIEELWGFEDLK